MNVNVIKPKVEWSFPCKGRYIGTDLVVGFSESGIGVVLDTGRSRGRYLYEFSRYWSMNQFEPIKEENQQVDWDKVELPVWVENEDKEILQINLIDKYEIRYYTVEKGGITHAIRGFSSTISRDEWLNSLEILPKNTEVRISI